MLHLSKINGVRVFRNSTAAGWCGQSKRLPNGDRVVFQPYPLTAGLCVGSSDIIGIQSIIITPEMVGTKIGQFVAIEVKTETGTATPEQLAFIKMVCELGGKAFVARNETQALELLKSG